MVYLNPLMIAACLPMVKSIPLQITCRNVNSVQHLLLLVKVWLQRCSLSISCMLTGQHELHLQALVE